MSRIIPDVKTLTPEQELELRYLVAELQANQTIIKSYDVPISSMITTAPTRPTKKEPIGVHYYMYNKIRIYLKAIQRLHGYPARNYHRVDFYGLLMLALPANWKIMQELTRQHWGDNRKDIWRRVIARPFKSNNILLNVLIDMNPFKSLMKTKVHKYDIYENLVVKSGLADHVIRANWDKIRRELMTHGY